MMKYILFILTFTFVIAGLIAEDNTKKVIFADKAPKPIGPYSQAIVAGDYIFLSGQIALDSTGKMVSGNAADEAKQIMQNIQAVLEEAGVNFRDVVKTTIYLTDLNDFAEVNEIYGSFFKGEYPARETVQVVALPKRAKVEISVIAYKPKNKLHKRK